MALQLAATDEYGNSYPNAYHRITTILVDQDRQSAFVYVASYINQQARTDGKRPFGGGGYECANPTFVPDFLPAAPVANVVGQGYGYLKTLPAFAGATDV